MPPTSASRPTAVVTGGAAGLGLAVAMQLRATHRVVLLARDPGRLGVATSSAATQRWSSGTSAACWTTRAAAAALLEHCPRIDVLVHNAGVWPSRRVLTEDGLEQSFVTNHLAPFLLSSLLDEPLRASAGRAAGSRRRTARVRSCASRQPPSGPTAPADTSRSTGRWRRPARRAALPWGRRCGSRRPGSPEWCCLREPSRPGPPEPHPLAAHRLAPARRRPGAARRWLAGDPVVDLDAAERLLPERVWRSLRA